MDHAGFGGVVGSLELGDVDDVAGHGGRRNEGAATLFPEVWSCGEGTVVDAVEVGADDISEVFNLWRGL